MMKNKKNNIPFKKYSYSLPIKMLLLMILALIGPISALLIYDYVRFHEVMFGQGDLFSLIYASSILLSITFVGYIVCEITKEITIIPQNGLKLIRGLSTGFNTASKNAIIP